MNTESNEFTPPPASAPAPVPASAPAAAPVRRTWISVGLAIFGGLALVGTGATAAVAASVNLSRSDAESVQRVDVIGVEHIDLDASASDVRVLFGDVDEAELSVSGGGEWSIERDDDDLVVRSPDSWLDWSFGPWFGGAQTVVLTLPQELEGAAASFALGAGSLEVSGTFGDLDAEVSAGDLVIDGAAASLDVEVGAGSAEILLDGVAAVDLSVSAGDLTVELTGEAPREIRIDTSAGSTDLTVPDIGYVVTEESSAGTIDNRLDQSSDARHTIDVTVSAGTVTLRPGK